MGTSACCLLLESIAAKFIGGGFPTGGASGAWRADGVDRDVVEGLTGSHGGRVVECSRGCKKNFGVANVDPDSLPRKFLVRFFSWKGRWYGGENLRLRRPGEDRRRQVRSDRPGRPDVPPLGQPRGRPRRATWNPSPMYPFGYTLIAHRMEGRAGSSRAHLSGASPLRPRKQQRPREVHSPEGALCRLVVRRRGASAAQPFRAALHPVRSHLGGLLLGKRGLLPGGKVHLSEAAEAHQS